MNDNGKVRAPVPAMPQDLDAEQALLGSLLIDPAKAIPAALQIIPEPRAAEMFVGTGHLDVFRLVLDMHRREIPVDMVTCRNEGVKTDRLRHIPGGVDYLVELSQSVPSAANVEYYARILKEVADRRRLLVAAYRITRRLEAGESAADVAAELAGAAPEDGTGTGRGPMLTCLADVEPVAIEWLWPNRIPGGRITLLVGRPGEGKSFLTTDIAARITTGSPWPDGSGNAPKGSVILVNCEDDPGDTTRPRLDAHYADVSRVHLLSMVQRLDEDGKPFERMFSLADLDDLEQALQQHPDCKLIVIDPIGSYLGNKTDAHRDNEVRSVLAPVAALAEKYGPAVLIVAHRRKSGGDFADDLALGSRAFTGLARATWHLSRDSMDKNRRLLLPGKNNLGPEGDGLGFSIGGEPARLNWERDPVTMRADDALIAERRPGPEPTARAAAEEWLEALLTDGPLPSGDKDNPEPGSVREQAKQAGFAWRTVRRAADTLGVRSLRNHLSGKWEMKLSKSRNQVVQMSPNKKNMDNLDNMDTFPIKDTETPFSYQVPYESVQVVQDYSVGDLPGQLEPMPDELADFYEEQSDEG